MFSTQESPPLINEPNAHTNRMNRSIATGIANSLTGLTLGSASHTLASWLTQSFEYCTGWPAWLPHPSQPGTHTHTLSLPLTHTSAIPAIGHPLVITSLGRIIMGYLHRNGHLGPASLITPSQLIGLIPVVQGQPPTHLPPCLLSHFHTGTTHWEHTGTTI